MKERAEFPEQYGSMMLDLGEPIGFLYGNTDLQEYALWSLACNDKVVEFLDRSMQVHRLAYSYFLERKMAEVYFLVGSELASPPLVSRDGLPSDLLPRSEEEYAMSRRRRALHEPVHKIHTGHSLGQWLPQQT